MPAKTLTKEQRADNAFRKNRGREVIERYRKDHDRGEDDTTVVTDLLADLMHAVHGSKEHINWQDRLEAAQEHYRAELAGED